MLDEKQKRKKKGRNCVSYNCGLYLFSQKKKTVGCTPIKKKKEKPAVLHNSYHPGKKRVLSIIIAQKGPKRGSKAIKAKNVSHDGTPIKHGLLHLW